MTTDVTTTEHFDIIIIGAGIHGAGIAQAAACYGYRVLVLEKSAVAGGTSSRSSKLIHGGLRYLETAQLALVRECLHERDLLLRIAPDLVRMIPFLIPVYKNTSRPPWKVQLGLSIYALLNRLRSSSRFNKVGREQWEQLDGLTTDNLLSVYQYNDAQTDDRALTKAVLQSAMDLGVELLMPAEFERADINGACEVCYTYKGQQRQCSAKVLVNAAGPWVNEVLQKVNPSPPAVQVDLVQGTHIVVDEHFNDRVYYLESPQDKRAVFVMPWKERVMIGTTEILYRGPADNVRPLETEVQYLTEVFQYYFPSRSNSKSLEIVERFAGLRVLPSDSGSAFRRSRDTMIYVDQQKSPNVVSLYGGKLTAYRATAEKILRQLLPLLPARKKVADSRQLLLKPVD